MQTINVECQNIKPFCSYEIYSNIGGREEQQDCAYFSITGNTLIATICDGMGGREAGRVASQTVISLLKEKKIDDHTDIMGFLNDFVDEVDTAVYLLKDEYNRRLKAGTTLVLAAIQNAKLYWLSVGDSRLYLKRKSQLVQVTHDHNYTNELNRWLIEGSITIEQYNHEIRQGDALTSFIGIGGVANYDVGGNLFFLEKDDLLLLASDGLWRAIDGEKLYEILNGSRDLKTIRDDIVMKINQIPFKERDNHTFILIRID